MKERRAPKKLNGEELSAYASRLLSMRAMSTGEVREKLKHRCEDPADIETVVGKLREYGYLNDASFAENFASSRRDSQGFGKQRVLRDLRVRRVAPGLAEKTVTEVFAESDEGAMIAAFLERKFRNVNLADYLKDEKHLASAYRKLRYAGFGSGAAIRVLKKFAAQADELVDESSE